MSATLLNVTRCPGTYALVLECSNPFRAVVGRRGSLFFADGYWIYVGSAFGPGGLRARLTHHLKPSARPHWHLDYIKDAMRPVEIWITTDGVKREHAWAQILASMSGAALPVTGFGASDCGCRSHLVHMRRRPGYTGFKRRLFAMLKAHGPLSRLVWT